MAAKIDWDGVALRTQAAVAVETLSTQIDRLQAVLSGAITRDELPIEGMRSSLSYVKDCVDSLLAMAEDNLG